MLTNNNTLCAFTNVLARAIFLSILVILPAAAQSTDASEKVLVGLSGGGAALVGDNANFSDAISEPYVRLGGDIFLRLAQRTSVGILVHTAKFDDNIPNSRQLSLGLGFRNTWTTTSPLTPYVQASAEIVNPGLDRRGIGARLSGGIMWTGSSAIYPFLEAGTLASFSDKALDDVSAESSLDWLPTAAVGVRLPFLKPEPFVQINDLVTVDSLLIDESFRFSLDLTRRLNPDVGFAWDMGDGTQYQEENVVHAYSTPGVFEGEVVVTLDGDPADSRQFRVEVVENYIGSSTGLPVRVNLKLKEVFGRRQLMVGEEENYRVSLVDDRARPVRFLWDMGDGVIAPGNNVVHRYDAAGLYEALVIGSTASASDTLLFLIEVVEPQSSIEVVDDNVTAIPASQRNPNITRQPSAESSTSSQSDGRIYSWVAESFLNRPSAERAMSKYPLAGLVPRIYEDSSGSGSVAYRILVGQYNSVRAAMAAKARVERVSPRNIFLYSSPAQ